MEKFTIRTSEVISFLEDLISDGLANQDEELLYENYRWEGKLYKTNYTYKSTILKMKKEYEGN